jgi:uncharacterized delta-60 repeat protein
MKKIQIIAWIFMIFALLATHDRAAAGVNLPDINATAIQSDGKIIIAGDNIDNSIARLNSDGTPDSTFNSGTGADDEINTIAIQSDGKIIIAGWFENFAEVSRKRIARLNSNGTLDTSFDPGTGADWAINAIAVQSDGQILIGGGFNNYNGTAINGIARLNANGTLDTTFDPGEGTDDQIETIAIQSDGKILIGGDFSTYNSINRSHIVRVNTNGTLDAGFDPGTGTHTDSDSDDEYINSLSIQPDGKIIIAGEFISYNGTDRFGIARINSNGSLDEEFNPGTGTSSIEITAIQSDGKIVIGGWFETYNGVSRVSIARINSNGTLDTSFNPGTGASYEGTDFPASGNIGTVSIQSDGKIVIGGWFDTYDGFERDCLTRINTNGTLDTSFGDTPAYRFANLKNGVYMYTISASEKNNIVKTLASTWRFEGAKYKVYATQHTATVPVYRFANLKNGAYLYTISEGEKTNIINNLSDTWRFEGLKFYVYSTQQTGTVPVYRFANLKNGAYLYTISESEKTNIINTLSSTWRFEGAKYYAPTN